MKWLRAFSATVCFLLWPASLPARLNLPQIEAHTQIREAALVQAREFFSKATPGERAPAALERALIETLPPQMSAACGEMISNWGQIAEGSETWTVLALHAEEQIVWLAFRCGSRAPDYSADFDERLAALSLDTGSLELISLGPQIGNDSDLYQLRFQEKLCTPGGDAFAFRVSSSTDNPCCGGGDRESFERLVVFTALSGKPVQILDLVTYRDTYSHDDEEGDGETVYRAEIRFGRDTKGRVASVIADYREESQDYDLDGKLRPNQAAPRVGKESFGWDLSASRFVKAVPKETSK